MNVTIYGAGYVGTVTAGCLAKIGHHVTLVDPVASKLEAIEEGRSPVLEPQLDTIIAEGVNSGRLRAERDAAKATTGADLAIVCVGTPSLLSGVIDTKALRRVFQAIAAEIPNRRSPFPVVVRSTILAPVLRGLLADIGPIGGCSQLQPVINPEFLRETTAVSDFFHPPFIVVGGDSSEALDCTLKLYEGIEAPRFKVSLETASMLKYACNSFHALKIAFANEIDTLASLIKADGREVMNLLTKDTILNISVKYLRPGFAFGGSCLPKDLRALEALAREHHEPLPLISSVLPSNRRRIEQAFERIMQNSGQRLAFIGLSFKEGSDDLRESPYVELAERLLGKGFDLKIYDPDLDACRLIGSNRDHALRRLPHLARILVEDPQQACDNADAVVLCKPLLSKEELRRYLPGEATIYDLDQIENLAVQNMQSMAVASAAV